MISPSPFRHAFIQPVIPFPALRYRQACRFSKSGCQRLPFTTCIFAEPARLIPSVISARLGSSAKPIPSAAVPVSASLMMMALIVLSIIRAIRKQKQNQKSQYTQKGTDERNTHTQLPPEVGLLELWRLGKQTQGFEKNRQVVLKTVEERYGQLFTIRFGPLFKLTIASGCDAIREVLRARESVIAFEATLKLADRINHAYEEADVGLASASYGRRSEMTGKVGSDFGRMSKILNGCQEAVVTETRRELARWARECRYGKPVVLHEVMSRAVIRIALRTLVGPEFVEQQGDTFWQAFAAWEATAYSIPWVAFPRTARKLNRKLRYNFTKLTDLLNVWLQKVEASPDLMPQNSYLRVLWERHDPETRSAFAGQIRAVLVGIHINTASSGAWTIAQALKHGKSLEQAQQESQSYKFTQWGDQQMMPTMTMIFHEVLRFYFNSMSMREVRKDFQYRDIVVPGDGRLLLLSIMSSHRDPSYYSSPDRFIVDRFKDAEFTAQADKLKKLMLWGGGPHVCPGRFMATCILRMIWSELLRSYDVSLVNDTLPDQDSSSVGISFPQSPIYIRVSNRK